MTAVYVYWGDTTSAQKRPQMLQLQDSLTLAVLLAKDVRELFGCAAWVADYFLPADAVNIRRRAQQPLPREKAETLKP